MIAISVYTLLFHGFCFAIRSIGRKLPFRLAPQSHKLMARASLIALAKPEANFITDDPKIDGLH